MNGPRPQFNGEGIGFAIDLSQCSTNIAGPVAMACEEKCDTMFGLYRGIGQGTKFRINFQKKTVHRV